MTAARSRWPITVPPYDVELWIVTTAREWATARRRWGFLKDTPQPAGSVNSALWVPKDKSLPSSYMVVVWIDRRSHGDDATLANTAAHEADHAVNNIFEHVGQTRDSEASAYLVGWLAEQIWRTVRG